MNDLSVTLLLHFTTMAKELIFLVFQAETVVRCRRNG
jgi:hypothetical protein